LDRITLEDAYRQSRRINALSWSKELQLLRTFFTFCAKRKWRQENPAKDMEMPPDRGSKPGPRWRAGEDRDEHFGP
jgi:site-specific recombinase XerD